MSAQTSPQTGQRCGVQRVCRAWGIPRSSFYHHRKRATQPQPTPRRRGPKPSISDEALLQVIRDDRKASPFHGEGHRKVWARLRLVHGIRAARNRLVRLMRENHLLSPRRARTAAAKPHDGTITTDAPNRLWGTDGIRVFTTDDGWGWVFCTVEHWNAECVGIHVCKTGDRFAALEPVAQGLTRLYGSVQAEVARGLALRMDHGSQYLSDHFQNQIRYWGITPRFALVDRPQTNGVAERLNRTPEEPVLHGRTFRTLDDVRAAITALIHTYNHHWLLQELGFLTPVEARQRYDLQHAQRLVA